MDKDKNNINNDDEGLLEGKNPVKEALKAGRFINKLWVLPNENQRFSKDIFDLIQEAKSRGTVIINSNKNFMDKLSTTGKHQGIIAQVAAHEYSSIDDMIELAEERGELPFIILLDGLKDPYNFGAILRVSDAAGVHGLLIPKHQSLALNASVARSSAGAIEHVPVARVTNLTQAIIELKEKGFWIYASHQDGETSYKELKYDTPVALIIGSEGEGISSSLIKHSDFLIKIPMKGKVNSLNAAVAAGILSFEIVNSR